MGRAERARTGGRLNGVEKFPEAAAARTLSEAEIEQIETDTKRMDHSERIIYYDKRQADPETRVLCPNDPRHGALAITGSGAAMICTARQGGAWCTANVPVSV